MDKVSKVINQAKAKMKTVSKLFVAIALFASVSSCKDKDKDKDVTEEATSTYELVKEKKTFADAAADAAAKGGYLVEIGSQSEQEAVYKRITEGASANYTTVSDGGGVAYVWIGATDKAQEGKWLWTGSGTNFWNGNNSGSAANNSFVNWGGKSRGSFNEPDNFGTGQNAAAIGLANWPSGASAQNALGVAGEWNDISETNLLYYVIEIEIKKE
ncbi:hypothetical protein FACS189464_3970 [Bacteroidia bacterium]|nr:hypothetical protein FACS189464_3970 [Bacteroidia bacterium]